MAKSCGALEGGGGLLLVHGLGIDLVAIDVQECVYRHLADHLRILQSPVVVRGACLPPNRQCPHDSSIVCMAAPQCSLHLPWDPIVFLGKCLPSSP